MGSYVVNCILCLGEKNAQLSILHILFEQVGVNTLKEVAVLEYKL